MYTWVGFCVVVPKIGTTMYMGTNTILIVSFMYLFQLRWSRTHYLKELCKHILKRYFIKRKGKYHPVYVCLASEILGVKYRFAPLINNEVWTEFLCVYRWHGYLVASFHPHSGHTWRDRKWAWPAYFGLQPGRCGELPPPTSLIFIHVYG